METVKKNVCVDELFFKVFVIYLVVVVALLLNIIVLFCPRKENVDGFPECVLFVISLFVYMFLSDFFWFFMLQYEGGSFQRWFSKVWDYVVFGACSVFFLMWSDSSLHVLYISTFGMLCLFVEWCWWVLCLQCMG